METSPLIVTDRDEYANSNYWYRWKRVNPTCFLFDDHDAALKHRYIVSQEKIFILSLIYHLSNLEELM